MGIRITRMCLRIKSSLRLMAVSNDFATRILLRDKLHCIASFTITVVKRVLVRFFLVEIYLYYVLESKIYINKCYVPNHSHL